MAKRADLRQAILDRAADRPEGPGPAASAHRQASRVGKVPVSGYYAPAVRRQLRRLALDHDTTVQALLGEGLNDLFAKYGLPQIVEP